MTDTRKELVRRFIMERRGSAARDLQDELIKALKAADIKVQEKELSEAWDKAFEELINRDREEAAQAGLESTTAPKIGDSEE